MRSTTFAPAFDLDAALQEARRLTGRDDPEAHLLDEYDDDLVRLAKLLPARDTATLSDDDQSLLGAMP
ncbi:hypothetical protein RZS08_49110 [Arthrospira platensis SPKY1]|nr:hypothetical protein [Arthrospira platensis SPKY1]